MTAAPEVAEALAMPDTAKRVAIDLPPDVRQRLGVWAALQSKPVAHLAAELVTAAVPDAGELSELVQTGGRRNGHAQH